MGIQCRLAEKTGTWQRFLAYLRTVWVVGYVVVGDHYQKEVTRVQFRVDQPNERQKLLVNLNTALPNMK